MEQLENKKVNDNDVTETLDKDLINDGLQKSFGKSKVEKDFADEVNCINFHVSDLNELEVGFCKGNLTTKERKENVSETLLCDSTKEPNESDVKESKSASPKKDNSTQEGSNNKESNVNDGVNQNMRCNGDKTPERNISEPANKSPVKTHETEEQDMMSELEQAKQLMAATEKYLQSLEKTPVKQVNPQGCQTLSNSSPGTPGRHKRVNLVTLASPKAKRFRPDFN